MSRHRFKEITMKKIFYLKRIKSSSIVNLSCVFMIVLLTGACTTTDKKQSSVKAESELSEISGDQTIECRRKATTGSRFKRKICKTKAQWARESGAGNKAAGDLQRDADRSYSTNSGVPAEGTFPGTSVPR